MTRKIFPWFDFNGILSGEMTSSPYRAFNKKAFRQFQKDANIPYIIINSADGYRQPYYILYKSNRKQYPWEIKFGSYSLGSCETTWDYIPDGGCGQHWEDDFGHDEYKICNTVFVSDNEQEIRKLSHMLNADKNTYRNINDIFDEFVKIMETK